MAEIIPNKSIWNAETKRLIQADFNGDPTKVILRWEQNLREQITDIPMFTEKDFENNPDPSLSLPVHLQSFLDLSTEVERDMPKLFRGRTLYKTKTILGRDYNEFLGVQAIHWLELENQDLGIHYAAQLLKFTEELKYLRQNSGFVVNSVFRDVWEKFIPGRTGMSSLEIGRVLGSVRLRYQDLDQDKQTKSLVVFRTFINSLDF